MQGAAASVISFRMPGRETSARRQVVDVRGGDLAVVGEALDALETEEVLGAVCQLQGHAASGALLPGPEVGDAAGDGHALAAPVAGLAGHAGARVPAVISPSPDAAVRVDPQQRGDHVYGRRP